MLYIEFFLTTNGNQVRHLLIILSFLLLSSPLFGQSSKCTRVQIGKMIKLGLSESEILEVCGKPTIKSEDKPKPVVEEPKPVVEDPKPVVEEPKPVVEEPKIKDVKEFLIQVTVSGIGEGLSMVYYYSDKISLGFDSLYRKEEISGTFLSPSGTQNAIMIRERSTSLIYGRYHLFSGSFYMQFGIVNRDWLIEAQYKSTSNNKNTVKYIATYPDSTTIVGIGWNWIADIGFSFSLGVSYIPTKPDYEYVEENDYYISESNKELWENNVNENTLETPAFIKLGWIF